MKNSAVLLLMIVCLGCKSFQYTRLSLNGTYRLQREDKQPAFIELSFSDKTFSIVDVQDYSKVHIGGFFCCDTVTRGVWEMDSKHNTITLSTPDLSSYIKSNIKEEEGLSRDSVYFFISAPLVDTMNNWPDNIVYTLTVGSDGKLFLLTENKLFRTSKIVLPNRQRDRVQNIQIAVSPDILYTQTIRNNGMGVGHTSFYEIKNRQANVFHIDMPKLTYQYITYLRFEYRVVKIVNRNELILDGNIYKRIR